MTTEITMTKKIKLLLMAALLCLSYFVVIKGVLPALKEPGGDFANYYSASSLLSEGKSIEPAYREIVWFQKQIDRYGFINHIGSFIPHPPTTALLFLPFSSLNPLTAKRLWTFVNMALIVLNIYLLTRISGLDLLLTAVLFMSAGFGLISNFVNGQLYLLLLTSVLLGLYFHKNQRPFFAGFCMGSLILVKYVGGFFLLYFIWRRQWKLVVAATGTIIAVLILTIALTDSQTFATYITTVLPHHLSGEIQNPFAFEFQSWNSFIRRLFIYDAILNPHPLVPSIMLYLLGKNLFFWGIVGVAFMIFLRIGDSDEEKREMIWIAVIPLVVLLLSPASAAYHLLLMTITFVLMVRVLLDKHGIYKILALALLFVLINSPLHLKLMPHAQGWMMPVAYSRLWLLLLFFIFVIYCLRDRLSRRIKRPAFSLGVLSGLFMAATAFGYTSARNHTQDTAALLRIEDISFYDRNILIKSPDIGGEKFVASNCESLDRTYGLFVFNGGTRLDINGQNYYKPDLFSDDSTFLAEMVVGGRNEIWMGRLGYIQSKSVARGQDPAWHPDGLHFVYDYKGKTFLSDTTQSKVVELPIASGSYDFSFSRDGKLLAYCSGNKGRYSLRIWDMISRQETTLLESQYHIASPSWKGDESEIIFSWNASGNLDIWSIERESCITRRITFSRANDGEPVWDETNSRIVFVSDRGRGLGFTTLYTISVQRPLK